MADIDIQKKQGPPILPIVLGLLALVAVVAAVMYLMRDDEDQVAGTPGTLMHDTVAEQPYATGAAEAAPASVQAFRQQCADTSQFREDMGVAHQHEAECLRQLAQGLNDVVSRSTVADQPLQQRVQSLRQSADQITQDPQTTDHANRVRSAALEAAEIIGYIAANRQGAGADLQQQAQQTRQAAEQIETTTPLLQQRERTATFFARAADALDGMARTDAPPR